MSGPAKYHYYTHPRTGELLIADGPGPEPAPVDISLEAVELVCDNLYGASCANGELDAARNMLRALRTELTARASLLREAVELMSLADTSCNHVHHAKADQHTTISCPVEKRFSDWEAKYWEMEKANG